MILVFVISVGINAIGTLVSIYTFYVTLKLRAYKLNRVIFFNIATLAITMWNISHLFLNYIVEDNLNLARSVWLITITSGFILVIATVMGYSLLKSEHIPWRLIFYSGLVSMLLTSFYIRPDWVGVEYDPEQGWVTFANNQVIWNIFVVSIIILATTEILYPLFISYLTALSDLKRPVLYMIIGIVLAVFSNSLLFIIDYFNLIHSTRYLVADIGFLLFFFTLRKYPFLGIYDTTEVHQVIIANTNSEVKYSISVDKRLTILTTGAIIGINTMLEEISPVPQSKQLPLNIFKRLDLENDVYYTAQQNHLIIIFHMSNPTGICIQKIQTLSKIFINGDTNGEIIEFDKKLAEYFPREYIKLTKNTS
jgi:hypothetical protein